MTHFFQEFSMSADFPATIGFAIIAAAACYVLFAVYAARRPLRDGDGGCAAQGTEPVTILKPLCGTEPRLYENLRSFCTQDGPPFQLVFGVRDCNDPAIAVVRRLQAEFSAADIELVIDPRVHGANLKISNLMNILARAKYDRLVLADSDIRVPPDYLSRVTAPLADRSVGVVTCLYRARPVNGFWSHLAGLFIDDWFAPSVRVTHAFGSRNFAFGSTIALRRDTLDAVGGLQPLRDQLADDYWLGELTRRIGLRTVLSEVVVETDVIESSLGEVWAHEVRWLRTIRSVEKAGFAFTFVTFTFPTLAFGLALAPNRPALVLAMVGAAARLVLHYEQRPRGANRRLAQGFVSRLLLSVLRDCLMLAEWMVALTGWRVRWRNQTMHAESPAQLPP